MHINPSLDPKSRSDPDQQDHIKTHGEGEFLLTTYYDFHATEPGGGGVYKGKRRYRIVVDYLGRAQLLLARDLTL